MKVLVVGSGGREHAIVWKLSQSPKVDKIYCAPGNAGIGQLAELVNIGAMEFHKLIEFVKNEGIDFTVVGMDDPLVGGIVDAFEKEGLRIFGPRANAAIIEGSKAFSKELMRKYNIPTAEYGTFSDYDLAVEHVKNGNFPVVLKADGLALGKGVLICNTLEEALEGLKEIMLDKKFGDSGNTVVIEEFLTGPEILSAMVRLLFLWYLLRTIRELMIMTKVSIQVVWVLSLLVEYTQRNLPKNV